jgi:hypothetical protein
MYLLRPHEDDRRGNPLASMRQTRASESRQLSDWPPVISPGAPEAGMYDQLQPVSGFMDTLTTTQKVLIAGGAVAAIWFAFGRKKGRSSGSIVGKSIRLKSIAAR